MPVTALIRNWPAGFQQRRQDKTTSALEAHVWSHAAFVRIHAYADGNGRMARLLASLPVIEKGQFPIFIPSGWRLDYIEALATWQLASGPPRPQQSLESDLTRLQAFQTLCESCLKESKMMLDDIRSTQEARLR